jgi:hypothetical protein
LPITAFCHKKNAIENKFWKNVEEAELATVPTARGTESRGGRIRRQRTNKKK